MNCFTGKNVVLPSEITVNQVTNFKYANNHIFKNTCGKGSLAALAKLG